MDTKANTYKGTFFQVFASLVGNLMAISDGMTVGWTAPMIPYLLSENSHIKITKHEAEWLETWLLVGTVVGIPGTLVAIQKIGRKKTLLLALIFLIVAWVGIALSNRIEYIYVFRVVSGMGLDMAFVAAPMYISEIADQQIRGFLSSIIYVMKLIGILVIYCVGPFFPFYVPSIIGVTLLLLELSVFSLMPESPYDLLLDNKYDEARKSLQTFRPPNSVEKELNNIKDAVDRQKSEKSRPQDIFLVKSNRKAVTIMIVLNSAQQLSSLNVIFMNMHSILEAAGSIYMEPSITAIVFAAIMLLAVIIASSTVDKFGRKTLMIVSSILTGLCLLTLAVYFNLKNSGYYVMGISWVPIVSVMVYAFVFKIGLGMVPIVITAEIFDSKIKAIGMTIAEAAYVVGSIVSIQIYQLCRDWFGMHVPFYIFSCCSFLTVLFVAFFIPETKGRSLEEIQLLLKGELTSRRR